jgi:hypothetical protein
MAAAGLLGMSFQQLTRDIDEGVIVAFSPGMGLRISKEELMAAAMRVWDQGTIEKALGRQAKTKVLPAAIRLVLLHVRLPRYQRDMLVALARKQRTSVDAVLARELEDVACARAEELAESVASLAVGLNWPQGR